MERSEEELRENYLDPAGAAMAQESDNRCANFAHLNTSQIVGILGTDPNSVATFYGARRLLKEMAWPPGKRGMLVSCPKRDAAPKIYSMEEWQRILASSATGFALGVVLEPIRFWLTAKLNQRKARLALHRCFAQISIDVNWMLDVIATYEEPEVMTRRELWNGLFIVYTKCDLTVCDYYRNSEKTTYYALREARGFNILYSRVGRSLRVLRKIAEDPRTPDALDRVIAEIEEIRKHLDGAAKLRHISTRLMGRYEKKLKPTAIEDAVGIFPIVKHKQVQQPQGGE